MESYREKYKDYKKTYGAITDKSDDDLKQIAKDIFNSKIYTDRHCDDPSDLGIVFMPLMLMGPTPPKEPELKESKDEVEYRNNISDYLVNIDEDTKIYNEDMVLYKEMLEFYNENRVPSIGLVYEYLSEQSPRSINFKPNFFL